MALVGVQRFAFVWLKKGAYSALHVCRLIKEQRVSHIQTLYQRVSTLFSMRVSTSALMYIWQGHFRSAEQYNLVWSLHTQVRCINVFQRYNVPDDQVVSGIPKPKVRHWRKTPDTSAIPNRKQWRRKKWQLSARSSMLTQLPHIWTRDLHSSHYEAK